MCRTTEKENLKSRVEALETLLNRIDIYLDNNADIETNSLAHKDIKLHLGKTQYGFGDVF